MPKEDTQFKPGESGNPGGRPPGSVSLTTLLKERLAEVDPKRKKTVGQLLNEALILNAMKGNGAAIREIYNRSEGKVKDVLDIQSDGNPIEFTISMGKKIDAPTDDA